MTDLRRALGKFTTAAGKLVAPLYLNEPDTKFSKEPEAQKFKAGLLLTGEDAAEFLGLVESKLEEWVNVVKTATGKKPRRVKKNIQWLTPDTERWDDMGESTMRVLDSMEPGEAIFKTSTKAFKQNAQGTYDQAGPKLFDASGQYIADPPPIGFGSTAKLSGTFYGYTKNSVANLTLLLSAVQLIELREPGAGGGPQEAKDFGFAPTEGFTAESFAPAAEDYDF